MAATPRELLRLGSLGTIPTDTLYQLFMDTAEGELLTFYQTRCSQSLGSWVYEAAACLAKYIESDHFTRSINITNSHSPDGSSKPDETLPKDGAPTDPSAPESRRPRRYTLRGKTLVEIGAGTGIVGIMAGYLGGDVIITDLEGLVPLIQYNIDRNAHLLTDCTAIHSGEEKLRVTRVVSQSLCWGCDSDPPVHIPDYLILANCVYYEGSLECLLQTVLELTDQRTKVLACYEERSPEIKKLIGRWHEMVRRHFNIREVDPSLYHSKYAVSYVRIVTFERLEATEDTSH